ncbi:hypothetical protein Vadar_007218 [Vaccinium darrowii]|uniref:Uncharacterized protein n=1 Tax=Vaccinium darrowii TaxID=229202 RepID=A0ACB7XXC2_9ERIC|nr:hypothetical protein Vadar_007218 [Vaccinium darrowii]
MGDTAIDFFLDTLKQLITSSKLDSIIYEKYQLRSLEAEIKYLRGFLKITEKKRNEHSKVMKLVMDIREVVSNAENIVERFVIDAIKADHLICKTKRRPRKGDYLSLDLEVVKKEIKTLTAEVKKIYDENIYEINGVAVKIHKHSSTRTGGSSSARGSDTSKVVKEVVVVGFDKEVERLIEMLDDRGGGRPLEIITIIGAAGGGKTTLAREVYNHPFMLYTFEIRAWVDVFQDYDKSTMKRDLLISILKSSSPENQEDYEKSSEDMLGEKVLRYLKGRKHLIVMDDIWGMEAWNDIERSFPKERNGSKVLFTSRQLVQLDSVRLIPHYLDPLPKDKSWELLQKKGVVFYLRYMHGTNTKTLDLEVEKPRDSIHLPRDIFKMVKLRHLYTKNGTFEYHFSSAIVGFDHFSKLDNLQTLHKICACKNCLSFLAKTPNLRKLGLKNNIGNSSILPDLEFLKCLETLSLSLVTLTAGLMLPLTIKQLTLEWTWLKWEELSILQKLPSLEVLKFGFAACEGPVWNTSEEGFSQLKYLSLYNIPEIEEWNASEDQFPRLEVLVLEYCKKLERIPIDFGNLNELREIKLIGCTLSAEELAMKIQEEQRNKKGDDDCLNLIVKSRDDSGYSYDSD